MLSGPGIVDDAPRGASVIFLPRPWRHVRSAAVSAAIGVWASDGLLRMCLSLPGRHEPRPAR